MVIEVLALDPVRRVTPRAGDQVQPLGLETIVLVQTSCPFSCQRFTRRFLSTIVMAMPDLRLDRPGPHAAGLRIPRRIDPTQVAVLDRHRPRQLRERILALASAPLVDRAVVAQPGGVVALGRSLAHPPTTAAALALELLFTLAENCHTDPRIPELSLRIGGCCYSVTTLIFNCERTSFAALQKIIEGSLRPDTLSPEFTAKNGYVKP